MSHREEIRALIESSHWSRARNVVRGWVRKDPSTANYAFLANLIRKTDFAEYPSFRIALLASFTHNLIDNALTVEAFLRGFIPEAYYCGYNQWQQELLVPGSGMDDPDPDCAVVLVQLEDVAPRITGEFFSSEPQQVAQVLEKVIADLVGSIKAFRQRSATPIIVQNFMLPSLGISTSFEWSGASGLRREVWNLNCRLAEELAEIPGAAILDYDDLTARVGRARWVDATLAHQTRNPVAFEAMPAYARQIAGLIRSFTGPRLKCIVTDLDNTLWGGVVGEDGLSGIQLGPEYPGSAYVEFQRFLLQMRSLGVLLTINSKNNEADAFEVFEDHPHSLLKLSHFTAHRINWQDKALNLRELAAELNIGIDSLMFVDDSAVECERVQAAVPEVTVVHLQGAATDFPAQILDQGIFFATTITGEDRKRADMYQLQTEVRKVEHLAASFDDFVRDLEMEVLIAKVTEPDVPRVAQLTQRTNQFNLTTRRYSESDIRAHLEAPSREVFSMRLKDRFGDYGLCGVVILDGKPDGILIDTFLMSCRVIGRTVEDVLLSYVCNLAHETEARRIEGHFIPTKKNAPARDFYDRNGFTLATKTDEMTSWVYEEVPLKPYPTHVRVAVP